MSYDIIGREKEILDSINLVILTTLGLSKSIHNAPVDTQITMDVLFEK